MYGYSAFGGAAQATPFVATMTARQEFEMLKGQAEHVENALNGIKKRIGRLEAKNEEK